MKLLFGHDQIVADWVATRIPHMHGSFRAGEYTAIGVFTDDGKPAAGVVYHNYFPQFHHVEISMASENPRWAQQGIIRALLSYPFDQMKCERITLRVPHTSDRVLKFVKGIGFVHEGTARRGFGDKHAVILGMLRKDFLKTLNRIDRRAKSKARQP